MAHPTLEISWQQLNDAVCEVKYPALQNEHAHFQFDVNVLNLTKESGRTYFLKEDTHLCYSCYPANHRPSRTSQRRCKMVAGVGKVGVGRGHLSDVASALGI